MRPTMNDIVFIPRALNRGRFVITDTMRKAGHNCVKLLPEHGSHYDGGWQLQSSVQHCFDVAIARRGIIESMSGCAFEPERYTA